MIFEYTIDLVWYKLKKLDSNENLIRSKLMLSRLIKNN